MISSIYPTKPGKLKRALTLRTVEWMPLLAGVLISSASTGWFMWRLLQSPAGSPGAFAAMLATPLHVRNIAQLFCALLAGFSVVCWIVRVISIIREN